MGEVSFVGKLLPLYSLITHKEFERGRKYFLKGVKSILDQFKGLALDELLFSLLFIIFNIKLTSVIFSNFSYYCMSPKEYTKLQRRVESLLSIGLIKKYLTLMLYSLFLTLEKDES